MLRKIALAAAVVAATIAAPIATANAGTINVGHGYKHYGNHYGHGYRPHHYGMSCGQARHYLRGHFARVWTVDCHGKTFTFKVRDYGYGPARYVKFNPYSGKYWF